MKPIIHAYREINVKKYKQVKHYELIKCVGTPILTEKINISVDRGFANRSHPEFWLKTHNGKKWSNNISGLFLTGVEKVYLGDLHKRKHLLIMQETQQGLKIYLYENYYPFNKMEHPKQIAKRIRHFNP